MKKKAFKKKDAKLKRPEKHAINETLQKLFDNACPNRNYAVYLMAAMRNFERDIIETHAYTFEEQEELKDEVRKLLREDNIAY